MVPRIVWRSLLVTLFLRLSAAAPARAQVGNVNLGDLNTRFQGGIAVPASDFGEYFGFGPTFGLDVGYPLRDRLGLILDLDLDLLNNGATYVPDTKAWRYRLGLEGDLLGGDGLRLTGHAGAGATTFRSNEVILHDRPTERRRWSGTHLTGTGGLRLGIETESGLTWWLSGDLNWSPVADEDAELLREATLSELDPFDSATNVAVTLGFSLR